MLSIRPRNKTSACYRKQRVHQDQKNRECHTQIKISLMFFQSLNLLKNRQSMNQYCYIDILARLHAVHKKCPKFWSYNWILHHDNGPSLLFGKKTLQIWIICLVYQIWYLVTCFFPKMKTAIKGSWLSNVPDIVRMIFIEMEFQEDPRVTFLDLTAFDTRGKKILAAWRSL